MIDLHTHIISRVDDGPRDMEESIEIILELKRYGIEKIVATPHYVRGSYENGVHRVEEMLEGLRRKLEDRYIDAEIYAGTEVYIDPFLPDLLKRGELMTINNTGKYLLIELPMQEIPMYTDHVLFDLKSGGTTPIIAHPERNMEIMKDYRRLYPWLDNGIICQICGGSLIGRYGLSVQRAAEAMLLNGMVHVIASDTHSLEHPSLFVKGIKKAERLVGKEKTSVMVKDIPEKIIKGEEI